MLRPHDILFGLLCLVLAGLLAFHVGVIVVALVGAFACGSVYVFAGMMPPASDGFCQRMFISGFLSLVVSSLILILPGTLGARMARPDIERTVLMLAAVPPLAAVCFEVIRTPQVIRVLLRWLGRD